MNTPFLPSEPGPAVYAEGSGMPGSTLDMRRIWAALYRHRYIVGGLIALALATGIVASLLTTPIYRAQASLQIDSETGNVLDDESQLAAVDWDVERFLQTQIDVLLSRDTALKLVERQRLATNDRFFDRMGVPAPAIAAPGKTMAETRRDAIADVLQANVDAQMPRYSRVVDLSFTSPDAAYAAEIANAYAEAFIAGTLDRRFDSSAYSREYLAGQLAEAKDALEEAERRQVDYARANNLVTLDGARANQEPTLSLTDRSLVNAADALAQARASRIAAEERYRAAGGGNPMQIPEAQQSPYIAQLQRDLAAAQADQSRDAARYKADHPVMQEYDRRIASLRRDLGNALGDVRGSLRQQYQAALRNEQRLSGDVDQLRGGSSSEQVRRVEFNILSRETATRRDMYDALLARLQEVNASAGITTTNISIVDRARTPGNPVRPRPLVNALLGLVAGLFLALLYVLLREFLDDAARSPEDVSERFGLPYLGSLPRLEPGVDPAHALKDPRSSSSEAFAALRTSLGLLGTNGVREVLVTSSQASEGKSYASQGLACSFSREGKRVLLVDADLRRPSQHRAFGVAREQGLSTVLTRQLAPADAVVTVGENLDLLPSGPLPPSVPEFFSGASFEEFQTWARSTYDVVVFDGPPVMGLADPVLLARKIEHTIFMIEAGRPSRGRASAAIRRLRSNGIAVDGAVLNMFDPEAAGYGSQYGHYYSYPTEKA